MDVKELVINICKNKNWAYEIDKENDGVIFEVEMPERNRTQICVAYKNKSSKGDLVEILSTAAEFEDIEKSLNYMDLVRLLQSNQMTIYAHCQINKEKTQVNVAGRTLLADATEKEVEFIINEVALYADIIEKQLTGKDDV
ncbi:MAG: hypothetical protein ACTSRZ_05660 [Promethearchaeota archaeon]